LISTLASKEKLLFVFESPKKGNKHMDVLPTYTWHIGGRGEEGPENPG
jgi:hypothetical protein